MVVGHGEADCGARFRLVALYRRVYDGEVFVMQDSTMIRRMVPALVRAAILFALCGFLSEGHFLASPPEAAEGQGLKPILNYISTAWDTLTRSMTECQSITDPKIATPAVLYVPAGFAVPSAVQQLSGKCNVRVEHLPVEIHQLGQITTGSIDPPGLLYLPNKYVVPGGRFNEMYGWDSYFIIRGLLQAGRVELARDMVENFFFEIEHYGAMLNANRTYYLTRSQPPFMSSMVVDVYRRVEKKVRRKCAPPIRLGSSEPIKTSRKIMECGRVIRIWRGRPGYRGTTILAR